VVATLVIFLREGVEASMIIAILLAYLNRTGQRQYFRDVFIGVGAALVLAATGGLIAYETIKSYDGSRAQTIFETATYLLAAVVLTYMTFTSHLLVVRLSTVVPTCDGRRGTSIQDGLATERRWES
jgi:high-affinity iron transporter